MDQRRSMISILFSTSWTVLFVYRSHALVPSHIGNVNFFGSTVPRRSSLLMENGSKGLNRFVARSHLESSSNPSTVGDDPELDSNDKITSSGKLLKPRAPDTPPPPDEDGDDDDETIITEAKELMSIQATGRLSPSPTYVIAKTTDDTALTVKKSMSNVLDTSSTLSSSVEFLQSGPGRGRPYRSSMELLRDSRRRAQKRLSRSEFERQKAEEKKARIRAKMEEQLMQVESSLKEKIDSAQIGINQEVGVSDIEAVSVHSM